jgi:hypothetical protein
MNTGLQRKMSPSTLNSSMQTIAIKAIDQTGALIVTVENTETPKDLPNASNTPAENYCD